MLISHLMLLGTFLDNFRQGLLTHQALSMRVTCLNTERNTNYGMLQRLR